MHFYYFLIYYHYVKGVYKQNFKIQLMKKFLNMDVELIENGKHLLLNEEEVIRYKVFSSIHRYLTGDV